MAPSHHAQVNEASIRVAPPRQAPRRRWPGAPRVPWAATLLYGPPPSPGPCPWRCAARGRDLADIFDEVDEELRGERSRVLARRAVLPAVLVLVLVALGVGGWQLWRWRQEQQARAVSGTFIAAMQAADAPTPGGQQAGRAEAGRLFADVARRGPDGYRVLAELREAGLHADAGELPAALELWNAVAADAGADPLLRGYASLLWVQHQVDGGDPAALRARLGPLLEPGNAWRPLAREAQALLDLRTGDDAAARVTLRQLAADVTAPAGTRQRASLLLQSLGETPPPGAPGTGPDAGQASGANG